MDIIIYTAGAAAWVVFVPLACTAICNFRPLYKILAVSSFLLLIQFGIHSNGSLPASGMFGVLLYISILFLNLEKNYLKDILTNNDYMRASLILYFLLAIFNYAIKASGGL